LESRIANTLTWVTRLQRWCPVDALSLELVKFDTQLLQNAAISGVEYQQGELVGYEVREYVLEKWGRKCASCKAANVPVQLEHIVPQVHHGSHRVSNLTIACKPCNDAKGKRTATEFGHPEIQAQATQPLRDAAAVNVTRWALYQRLTATGAPLETGMGGRTKWNRTRRGLPKTHWMDAACLGASTPQRVRVDSVMPVQITAMGRHSRQMCRTNAAGFPRPDAHGHQRGRRLSDGGSGAGGGPEGQRESGRLRRPGGGAGVGSRQGEDRPPHHRGPPRALLPAAAARRWLPVHDRYTDRRGASSPGLKAGVSAPQRR
jgi:hypothetical protein